MVEGPRPDVEPRGYRAGPGAPRGHRDDAGAASATELEAEVEARIQALMVDDEALARYDLDGDGCIDDDEWGLLEAAVRSEVKTDLRRRRAHEEASPTLSVATAMETLRDRYELYDEIGHGGQGRTFLGRDMTTGAAVAVKLLSMGEVTDWKQVELFERESRALRGLDHPGLAGFVDAFQTERGGVTTFALVQELIEGEPLDKYIAHGGRFSDEELVGLTRQVLEILRYLHGLNPPVIHRDIKPANLILRPDGTVALVDFGAIQSVAPGPLGGSTVVGTGGYMPPEQLVGRAVPSTDLYALGATIVHLASHVHPVDLPMERMRLDYRHAARLAEPLDGLVASLLEPMVEDRCPSAEAALRMVDGRHGRGSGDRRPATLDVAFSKEALPPGLVGSVTAFDGVALVPGLLQSMDASAAVHLPFGTRLRLLNTKLWQQSEDRTYVRVAALGATSSPAGWVTVDGTSFAAALPPRPEPPVKPPPVSLLAPRRAPFTDMTYLTGRDRFVLRYKDRGYGSRLPVALFAAMVLVALSWGVGLGAPSLGLLVTIVIAGLLGSLLMALRPLEWELEVGEEAATLTASRGGVTTSTTELPLPAGVAITRREVGARAFPSRHVLRLESGGRALELGDDLTVAEQRWIEATIKAHLAALDDGRECHPPRATRCRVEGGKLK